MNDALTISPILNMKLELLAAKTEVEYLLECESDKAASTYDACLKALQHVNNALSLIKEPTPQHTDLPNWGESQGSKGHDGMPC